MRLTRRLLLGMIACLPLTWQRRPGAVHAVPVATSLPTSPPYRWLYTTFDGHGSLLAYLRQQYNAANYGMLAHMPREIRLGPKAFVRYEEEWDAHPPPLMMTTLPRMASIYAFKATPVFQAQDWPDWQVGLLAPRHS